MSKNIDLAHDTDGQLYVKDHRPIQQRSPKDLRDPQANAWYLAQHHFNVTWLRSGYFLRWRPPSAEGDRASEALLIVFSASDELKLNFESLAARSEWEQVFHDPFSLLVVIAEDVFLEVSTTIYKLLSVVREKENVCIREDSSKRDLTFLVGSPRCHWRVSQTRIQFCWAAQHIQTYDPPERINQSRRRSSKGFLRGA